MLLDAHGVSKKDLKLVNHLINALVAFKCRKVAFLGGTD